MSVDTGTGKHIPKNSMLFEFDSEVIAVFDNMASRSIVGYEDAYKSIEYLLQGVDIPRGAQVWDMGTTTGKGLITVKNAIKYNPYVDYFGCDISEASVKRVRQNCMFANIVEHDLTNGFPEEAQDGRAAVIIFGWTLQFIESLEVRERLIQEAYDKLMKGGLLFVMEKYEIPNPDTNKAMQDAYIQFRRDNGYTLEEIDKKTTALKNAMWPESPAYMTMLMEKAGFPDPDVLYRKLNFGGMFARKL